MVDIQGDFDLFATAFPHDLLPSVFQLILDEWPNAPRPEDTPLENRITNRFVAHLQNVLRTYELPRFKFHYRPKLPNIGTDSEAGEVDIQVDSFSRHPNAFLVIECKRLNVETDSGFGSLAGEYIGEEGMGCFLSGQYASGGDVGAMLGYVMTRTIDDAITFINKQLSENSERLFLREPHALATSSIVQSDRRIWETSHMLSGKLFRIAHLFVKYL